MDYKKVYYLAYSILLFQNEAGVKEEVKDYKRVYY